MWLLSYTGACKLTELVFLYVIRYERGVLVICRFAESFWYSGEGGFMVVWDVDIRCDTHATL
jgi:hypothetical protein